MITSYILHIQPLTTTKQDTTWNLNNSRGSFKRYLWSLILITANSEQSVKLLYESTFNRTSLKIQKVGFRLDDDSCSKGFPFLPIELMHCLESWEKTKMNYNTYFHLKKKTFVSPLYFTVNTSLLTQTCGLIFPEWPIHQHQLRVLQFNSNTVYLELRTHRLRAQSYEASPISDANIKSEPPLLWLATH